LHEHHGEVVRRPVEQGDRRLHATDITVVVGAPYVDELVVAPLELVFVIGHVGGKIGGDAVAAHHHPVLIVTVLGGFQPDGLILDVGGTGFL